ncbi:MAG TPA: hypothetical protein VKA59_28015 [Vicinamibacterales bacterium]|nr:hypothetical protein [Vicinamibacterales bacterium]
MTNRLDRGQTAEGVWDTNRMPPGTTFFADGRLMSVAHRGAGSPGDSRRGRRTQRPRPLRGSCNLEPGLQGRSDLLMFEDFERSTWQSAWSEIDFQQNLSAVSSPVFAGSRGLEMRVPTGQHDGASFWGNIYVGGGWVADRNMAIHFDNIVVARNRIGGGSTPSSEVPPAPQNIRILSSGAE